MAARGPHALVVPFPAQGHINPLLLLCRRLHSMGFTITFLSTRSSHNRMFKGDTAENGIQGFRFWSVPDECLPQGRLGNNLQEFLNALEGIRGDVEQVLQQLMDDTGVPPVTCIISDAFIGWTQDVARKFGICRASLWTTSVAWAIVCMNLDKMEENGLLPVGDTSRVIDFLPGFPPVNAQDLPSTICEVDPHDPGFKLRLHRNRILKEDAWVLVNTIRCLEADTLDQLAVEAPGFAEVGPLLPPDDDDQETFWQSISLWKKDVGCLEWLDKQETSSVLYIAFGSLATLPVEQLKEISIALSRSGCAFLWVIRLDLMDSEEQRNEVLEFAKNNKQGMIISWAPQLEVLRHPSVAAFLTHCGWNSLMEAISAGVPVLTWPCFAEQQLNAVLAVEHWKVGLYARRKAKEDDEGHIVDASSIENAIREITVPESDTGVNVRRRARELGHLSAACVKEGGSSFRNLEAFVQDMKRRSQSIS